ncbi:bacteriocin fulvocin C-related protein (plasmid) [Streptomyces sp. NBC_00012]|uniref:bacteriocin fulvocin C-related protein n=1 Tax=Streptomyces sp. NBC_00012 TaxID=2975621 RepID=UPI003249FD81
MDTGNVEKGQANWVLAFDASCGTCREVSEAVRRVCGGKLEVLPLMHRDVEQWRERALGAEAAWVPTLLRVRDAEVRAWTGKALAAPLVRRLGLRSTLRVLTALGQLRQDAHAPVTGPEEKSGVGRKQFLRLGAGIVVAGGLVLTGRTPSFAEDRQVAAKAWVEANRNQLPQSYDAVIAYNLEYRRAIYRELPASARRQLWLEQLQRYRADHPSLTAEQHHALDHITAIAEKESTFAPRRVASHSARKEEQDVKETAVQAFGHDEAYAILASLGPSTPPDPLAITARPIACTCSDESDWCTNDTYCKKNASSCDVTGSGCGQFWEWACNGRCRN